MNRKKDKSQLTEVELELMNSLWSLGEGSVSDVIQEVGKERKMAYTSVATILGILQEKKFLGSRKEGKSRIFTTLVDKAEYESRSLNKMVKKLFNNAPVAMVARLVAEENISESDLLAMRRLLDERLKDD